MDFQFPNSLTASQQARLNALGNLADMYMGMATEGGRNPYVLTVSANKASGATWINGNWWQGDPVGQSGYSLGVMQYDFGNFANASNTANFVSQIKAYAQ